MGPLENIKVVELATYLAAPTCARVLADWGADVIKVEPLKGDIYRTMGPTQMCPITEKANPTFDNHNSGKKYVALNLRSAEGMEAFHRLLAQADVFVTNNRPDALEAMHLTYDDLKDKYPRLIFAHVLGYGEKGPDYNKPGFDYTAFFSRSGILAALAPARGPPSDLVTGMGGHAASLSPAGRGLPALRKAIVLIAVLREFAPGSAALPQISPDDGGHLPRTPQILNHLILLFRAGRAEIILIIGQRILPFILRHFRQQPIKLSHKFLPVHPYTSPSNNLEIFDE